MQGTFEMQSSHTSAATLASFDDDHLIGYAGLVPLVRLAERAGLPALVSAHLDLGATVNSAGANPVAKVMSVVAGMCAGADSFEDLDRLRHGAMGRVFDGIRAPSTLGTFARCFTYGHNRQLGAVHRRFLAALARTNRLLPGADTLAFVDIDPTHVRVFGRKKAGAEYGRFKGVRTLHPILSCISTPGSAPVIGPVRLRRGKSADVRGAASFVTEAIGTARDAGCTGTLIVRADSKFYCGKVVAACRRADARFSIATGMNPGIRRAIAAIAEPSWTRIEYPRAIEDPDTGELISIAQIAEVDYTAFASDPAHRTTARLIVRRVRDLAVADQDELFPVYRYHALFTDSPHELTVAEPEHRGHAIIEGQIADFKDSALAHLPSGVFEANHAWLILAAIAHNLTRTAGVIAHGDLALARTATIRARLIQIPGRIAHRSRHLQVHLPTGWPWEQAFTRLFTTTHTPPGRTRTRTRTT